MTTTKEIRAIVFKEGDVWVAQCLEFDIGAQATSIEELDERLQMTIQAELETSLEMKGSPFEGIPAAPKFFFEMWESQAGKFEPKNPPKISVDHSNVHLQMALCA